MAQLLNPEAKSDRGIWKVIFASSAGTMIEWYDFYIFGALATTLASKFYQTGTTVGDLIAWLATFAIGFIVRPFGAIVFGRIGDIIGRKYTFLVTMTLMGLATFSVGLLPTIETLGVWAGVILIALRIIQGLALGVNTAEQPLISPSIPPMASAASIPASSRPPLPWGFFSRWVLSWLPG